MRSSIHLFRSNVFSFRQRANVDGNHMCVFVYEYEFVLSTWAWNLFLYLLSTAFEMISLIFLWATVDNFSFIPCNFLSLSLLVNISLSFPWCLYILIFDEISLTVFVCDKLNVWPIEINIIAITIFGATILDEIVANWYMFYRNDLKYLPEFDLVIYI